MQGAPDFPHFLLYNGAIDQQQLQDILTTVEKTHRKPCDVVVKKGFAQREEVLTMLQRYTREAKQ